MSRGSLFRIALGAVAVVVTLMLLFGCKAPEPTPDGPPAIVHVTTTSTSVLAG